MSNSEEENSALPVEIQGDKNVRNEITQWLRSGQIDYNYQIETNFFTGEDSNHSDIIDIWREDYENDKNKTKFKIMKKN
jgi:hypothetical protein